MPLNSKGRSSSRPSTRKALASRPQSRQAIPRQPGGFPDSTRATLTYCDEFTLDPAVLGVSNTYDFSAIGLYDPNITGVGHQPLAFDQWMAVYSHYAVNNSSIEMMPTFVSSTNATPPCVFGVSPSYTTGQFSALTIPGLIEKTKQGTGSFCNVNNINYGSAGTKLKARFSRAKVFRDRGITDPDLAGNISSNPSEAYIFSCWAAGASASDGAAQTFMVIITYDVTFFERRLLPQS